MTNAEMITDIRERFGDSSPKFYRINVLVERANNGIIFPREVYDSYHEMIGSSKRMPSINQIARMNLK